MNERLRSPTRGVGSLGGEWGPMIAWRPSVLKPAAITALCLGSMIGCAHLPRERHASVRIGEYLAAHRELPPVISEAMETGHVVLGMDEPQVRVVLGDPARRTAFGTAPVVDVWLYPGYRLHQDPMRSHGVQLFRLVFIDGRLALIEPM